ncbi:hypothetical protein TrST_g203 [Triparma strigata]|uniref:Pentatricopeptide repeat-containing protein n=1 Tax=Triparma strigata TaxID=1606541 RepID=A0A9W7A4P8_9STRA|nr:hypothetical protein TrST_g203 [Triparma strigata]
MRLSSTATKRRRRIHFLGLLLTLLISLNLIPPCSSFCKPTPPKHSQNNPSKRIPDKRNRNARTPKIRNPKSSEPYPPPRIGRLISRLSKSDSLGSQLRYELQEFSDYALASGSGSKYDANAVDAFQKITAECGRMGYTALAEEFVTKSIVGNIFLDKMAYLPLLGSYERASNINKLNSTICTIAQAQTTIDPRAITIYLRCLTRMGRTSVALEIAHSGSLYGVSLDCYAYNVVLFTLSKLDDHEAFMNLYDSVKERVGLDTFSKNSLLRSLVTSNNLREAVRALAHRQDANEQIDAFAIDLVLPELVKNWDTWGESQTASFLKCVVPKPTQKQRSAWIVSICKAANPNAVSVAEKLLDGCDNIGWNAVIDGHRKAEQYKDAFRVAKMMARDAHLQPDDFTVQTLLRSRSKPQGVKRIWRMARKSGMLQAESHWMSYIYQLGCLGEEKEALREFGNLETQSKVDHKINPRRRLTTKSYNILLKMLCSKDYRDEYIDVAVKTVDNMIASGPTPDSITYTEILKALASCKPSSESREVSKRLIKLEKEGCDGRLINAYIRCFGDQIDEALDLWSKEIRDSLTIAGNRKQNQLQGLTGLLYCCGRAGRPDHALKIVYAINKELGITPTESLLQTYINGKAVGQKKIGFAMKVFEDLLEVETKKFNVKDSRSESEPKIKILW